MFVPTIENSSKGVYMFGKDNMLPNKLMKWVLDSGTATKAKNKRSKYIASDGFVDDTAANIIVSTDKVDKTADKLLTEISDYQSYFKGFVLLIKRKPSLNNVDNKEVCVLPFQDVRKKLDGTFEYNPTFSSNKIETNKCQIIQPYEKDRKLTDPLELAKIKDYGEILYCYHKSADNPNYPIPDYYAGIEDIRTSAEIQKLDFEAATNGFLPSAILTMVGELDNTNEDEEGKTEQEHFDEALEQFTGNVKDADGKSRRMSLMVTTARTKDEIPVLQPYDAKPILDASNTKRDVIDRAVCRLFSVPPPLCGFTDAAVLGNQQAMANASQELNNDVISDQQLITEAMSLLYPGFNWDITTFRPIQFIPDSILKDLTVTERRALMGYSELPSDTTSEKTLADTLGVGGTQSLVSVLSDPLLTPEQKQSVLIILFGLKTEDAAKLVPSIITGAA